VKTVSFLKSLRSERAKMMIPLLKFANNTKALSVFENKRDPNEKSEIQIERS